MTSLEIPCFGRCRSVKSDKSEDIHVVVRNLAGFLWFHHPHFPHPYLLQVEDNVIHFRRAGKFGENAIFGSQQVAGDLCQIVDEYAREKGRGSQGVGDFNSSLLDRQYQSRGLSVSKLMGLMENRSVGLSVYRDVPGRGGGGVT